MINIVKKLGWFIKQEWKAYLFMIIGLLLIASTSLMPAYFLGLSIDTIVSGDLTSKSLFFLVFALASIPVFRYFLSFVYNYFVNKKAQQLSFTLRSNYLDHLFQMDLSFYEKYDKGDLISRVTNDLQSITIAATSLIEGIILNTSLIVISIALMSLTISWKLTIISVTIMPIGLTILNIIRHSKRKYILKHREIYAEMTETILESVEGQKTIRAYVEEENDLKKQHEALEKDIESWRYIVTFENWFAPLFEIIYGIAYILAFGFGIYFIINSEMTLGGLITFVSYIGMLYGPIISMSNIFSQINNATIALDRFDEIMNEAPKVKDTKDSKQILIFNRISFNNISFKYPFDDRPVLENITFDINKGQTIGIVGPTGAGKSTLVRQLLREFNTTEGNITIDGINIEEYIIEDIRKLVGYVPQSHTIFRRAVDENIKMGNPKATSKELDKAVMMADFEKDLSFLDLGLNTMVGESGSTLSGGQKQRLSIARALIRNPEILILDDSLSAVDMKTEDNIINKLNMFREDKTNIVVSHRFSAVKDADLILVLEKGKITQRGTHDELLEQGGWYKTQYINQVTML